MRKRLFFLAGVAGLSLAWLCAFAAAGADEAQNFPGMPKGLPDGWRDLGDDASPQPPPRRSFNFGLDGFRMRPGAGSPPDSAGRGDPRNPPDGRAGAPDRAKDTAAARAAKAKSLRAENLRKALAPHEAPAAQRRRSLDALFTRLRAASNPAEAQSVAGSISQIWLQSPSDTAELLMQRAMASLQRQDYPLALALLDKVLVLEPEWAEAWNQRATARFLSDDSDGAMADINQTLKLEPRHFGALAGLGLILTRAGLEQKALEAFAKALEIYPMEQDLQKTVERLKLQIDGRDI